MLEYFVDIPTEQTTAVTDLILAAQAFIARYFVGRTSLDRPFFGWLWSWIFCLLGCASLLGAVAHGVEMTKVVNETLWIPLYLVLGLVVAFIALTAISHFWHEQLAQRWLLAGIGVAVIFFAVTQLWSDSFMLFIVYEAVMMTFAFVLYTACIWRTGRQQGSSLLASGVFVGLVAAAVDTQQTWRLECIWTFDNHGIFHLVQMLSLLLISIGLYRSTSSSNLLDDSVNGSDN
jgi:hypothetical protein